MNVLKDKVAVVTGGSSGIGKAIALRFAREGAQVLIVGRIELPLQEVAKLNERISYIAGDITSSETVEKIVDFVTKKYNGKLDILVNNAGWCPVQPITKITVKDYDEAFNLDVRAVVDLTSQSLPLLIKSKGNIINLSSVGASHPAANLSMYVGAKAAIENFTKAWALDLADYGVRVNAVAPGAIETNIWNVTDLSAEKAKEHKDNIARSIPAKRFGSADEVANVALFLASDQASYVNGSIYSVDGASGAL